jgi:hypothetical protein
MNTTTETTADSDRTDSQNDENQIANDEGLIRLIYAAFGS